MLLAPLKRLKSSRYFMSVFTLASGTAIAQALPVAIAPILTRLYSPSDFGLLALYMSIVGILGAAATWRYELAIVLPERDDDAVGLVIISFWAAMVTSVCTFVVVIFYHARIAVLLGNMEIEPWLFLAPLSIFVVGIYNALNYWLNRHERYLEMSHNRMIRSGAGSSANVGLGLLGFKASGLIIGNLVGQLLSTVFIAKIFFQQRQPFFSGFHKKYELAKIYKKHPAHLLPSHFIGAAATQLPVFMISYFYGAAVTGFYSVAQRMISMPASLVANAIGDVYRQQVSMAYIKKGEFRSLYLRTLYRSFFIAVIPFSILFFIAPDVFAFVFGKSWQVAGEYARILIVGAFFQFIYAPVDKGALVVGATRYIFGWHVGRLLGFLVVAACIYWGHINSFQVLWGIVLVNSFLYLVDIVVGYKFSLGKTNHGKQ